MRRRIYNSQTNKRRVFRDGKYVGMLAMPRQKIKEVSTPRSSSKFRTEVLARDEGCIITGIRETCLLDAAHIKPRRHCEEGEYDDPENGITLSATLHRAFDNRMFTIWPNGRIVYSQDGELEVADISVKLSPTQHAYMDGHREWFLRLHQ